MPKQKKVALTTTHAWRSRCIYKQWPLGRASKQWQNINAYRHCHAGMKFAGRRYGDAYKARMFCPTLNRWLRELEAKLATAASAAVHNQTSLELCSTYLPACAKSGKYKPEPATATVQNASNVEPHHRLVSPDPKAVVPFVAYPISYQLPRIVFGKQFCIHLLRCMSVLTQAEGCSVYQT